MRLRHRPARGMAVVAIGLAATLIAACGAPPHSGSDDRQAAPTTSKPWDGLTGTQREDALVAAAKAEGELTVYSAFNDEQAMADAFTKKYGIKVNVYNANSETVLQRVVQEATAHKLTNDVLVAPATDMTAVESKGLLGDYRSPYRDAMPDAGKSTGWTGVRRLAFVAGYNTGKLTATDLPADYAGFADPKWNGRISMEYSDIDWYATVRRYYQQRGMSDDDISTMFRKIAANSKTAKGHTVQAELLAAGQFDVALSAATISDQRAQQLYFMMPIAEATHYYMKRKGDTRIQSIKDLSGLTIGTQQGSSIHQRLPEVDALLQKTGGKLGKVSLYASYPEAYQDLANGRIDYVLNSVVAISDVLRKRPGEFELGQAVVPIGYHAWAVKRGNKELRDFLNQFFTEQRKNGNLYRLQEKWLGRSFPDLPWEAKLPGNRPMPE